MRIGMRLLLGYFLLVAVAAWFVLAIFVKEVKPGVRRATEGTLIDTATYLRSWRVPICSLGTQRMGNWRRRLISYNIARFAPILVALTKCAMNIMSI